jgi:hypothetical protein
VTVTLVILRSTPLGFSRLPLASPDLDHVSVHTDRHLPRYNISYGGDEL